MFMDGTGNTGGLVTRAPPVYGLLRIEAGRAESSFMNPEGSRSDCSMRCGGDAHLLRAIPYRVSLRKGLHARQVVSLILGTVDTMDRESKQVVAGRFRQVESHHHHVGSCDSMNPQPIVD